MIVLASGSPRRKEILGRFLSDFIVCPTEIEENKTHRNVEELVMALSFEKAYSLWEKFPKDIILGSDTVVSLEGRMMGKPKSREEGREMLLSLSGKTHEVFTGYSLLRKEDGVKMVNYSLCEVTFRELEESLIECYLDRGEYQDKAGAYGIQGLAGIFVEKIHGDYETVVGLPISAIARDLREYFGFYLL